MCGIAGIVEAGKDNQILMEEMLKMIEHRGPDDVAVFSAGDVTLGHRRLSIIDVIGGRQPIFNEDRSLSVIFNGEIYNHQQIRQDLESRGHQFTTHCDTEVLVHGFEEYGTELFNKLNGIFAFALLQINEQRLYLVRDHFGIKPVHYYHKNGVFLFGSEQKSMLLHPKFERKLNHQALHSHLNFRYTQRDETLFEGVKRLPPAHYLKYEAGNIELHKYYALKICPKHGMKESDAIDGLNFYMKQAVERQLMSEVPLGVYLSGGLDSSAIVQKMSELGVGQINTFTMGFNEPTDEFSDAKRIADHFGTNHHTLSLSMNPMQQFPEVIWHAEEPKINLLQGFNMSKFVGNNITVVLGGLGGDELLAGYDIHKFVNPFNGMHKNMPRFMQTLMRWKSNVLFKIQNASGVLKLDEYRRGMQMLLSIGDIERFYCIIRNEWDFDKGFIKNVYSDSYLNTMGEKLQTANKEFTQFFNQVPDLKALDQVLYTEFNTKMVNDYLLTEDRMSMANSVEERVPFLDKDLVEYAFNIPHELKIKNGQTKYLFRKAMEGKLPKENITKKKRGFSVNPYLQFKKDLGEVAEKVLTKEFVEHQGIFNYDYIRKILDYPPHPKLRWHYNYLWIVMGVAIWQKMFIDTDMYKTKNIDLEAFYS